MITPLTALYVITGIVLLGAVAFALREVYLQRRACSYCGERMGIVKGEGGKPVCIFCGNHA